MKEENPNLLTAREAAAQLGYDESHVRRLCLSGKLKAAKFGHAWMVSENAIARWRKRRSHSEKEHIKQAKKGET